MFGIRQWWEALSSAHLQIHQKDIEADMHNLTALRPEDFQKASAEEKANIPILNKIIQRLYKHLRATSGQILGTDDSHAAIRSKIWSTTIKYSPPSLWITINPTDIHDPVAQVFIGENIDMDNFDACLGPSAVKRAQNIADDPYAATKFFYFIIHLILHTLFGVEVIGTKVESHLGLLGKVMSYIGVFEAQNRGSLHLHMLLWLQDMPPADEMKRLLKSHDFCE